MIKAASPSTIGAITHLINKSLEEVIFPTKLRSSIFCTLGMVAAPKSIQQSFYRRKKDSTKGAIWVQKESQYLHSPGKLPMTRRGSRGGATGLLPPPENQARMAKIRHFTRDLGPRTESAKARGGRAVARCAASARARLGASWLGLTRDTSLLVPRPSRRARLQEDAALPLPPALPQPRPGSARL
ncbi:hypothetical protein J6590_086051 [Homalodisca vitripennis]|nr:hypothetical protein J6590_086051 [Homalodisca vitripennis]